MGSRKGDTQRKQIFHAKNAKIKRKGRKEKGKKKN